MVIFGKVQTDKDGINHCEIRVPNSSMCHRVRCIKTLPSTDAATDTDTGTDTGVIDHSYGWRYGRRKDTYGP